MKPTYMLSTKDSEDILMFRERSLEVGSEDNYIV